MTYTISCRAKVASGCLDGAPTSAQFFGDDLPMTEDGTYRPPAQWTPDMAPVPGKPDGGTIVCDACYVWLMPRTASGQGLNHELDAAIEAARRG